ncbi:hypothetical protein B296_00027066 [Ensete ventricosum]|uniref:Uncharacterized protein n=1 Tax=Ensete ventricosum TaxID=4639 RepID=A0A426Y698_ENSVE|nr:hypothetical protein B296_00027066 [Ensete ventricosum]
MELSLEDKVDLNRVGLVPRRSIPYRDYPKLRIRKGSNTIPYRDHPKLRIRKGSNTYYQSSVLGVSLPFHSCPSSFHSHLKQFPQLLRSSSNSSSSPLPQIIH